MKQILTFLLLIVSIVDLNGQNNIIELNHEKFAIPGQNFFITEVIDGRRDKENIGFVQLGAFNKKVTAYFKNGLENSLNAYFTESQTVYDNFEPLLLRITYLEIYEKTTINELGRADIKVEFYKTCGDSVSKIFEAEAYEEEYGMDVTKGHEKRIRSVLTKCLTELAQTDWKSVETEWIAKEDAVQRIPDDQPKAFVENKKRINAPWADLFNIYYSVGNNAKGLSFQYLGYADTIQIKQWFIPVSYTLSVYMIRSGILEGTDYVSSGSFTGGVLIPFNRKLSERFYLSLQAGLGLGFESLKDVQENVETRFIVDAVTKQYIMLIPVKDAGINLGLGVHQYFVTSSLYNYDLGVDFMVGFKF